MLVGFRDKCPFRQYTVYPVRLPNMKSKFMHCVMLKLFYVWNMEIYPRTQPEGPYKADKQYNSSQGVVTRLITDIPGSARNITFDNW